MGRLQGDFGDGGIGRLVRTAAARAFLKPDFVAPPGGLHYRWPDLPGPHIEQRLEAKKNAVLAFAKANPIDRHIYDIPDATYGIVTTGKAHLDLMEALRLLGLDEAACRKIGLDIYKVGMVWPLAHHNALDFVREKREILIVEEKRGIIESQFKEYFYDYPGHKPERMVGKYDENNEPLVPWTGELSPRLLAPIVAKRLDAIFPGLDISARAAALAPDPMRSSTSPARRARRISARAARTTPRPRCRRDRRRWRGSAAISWRAGWIARPLR